jgi:hypothetical protein
LVETTPHAQLRDFFARTTSVDIFYIPHDMEQKNAIFEAMCSLNMCLTGLCKHSSSDTMETDRVVPSVLEPWIHFTDAVNVCE